MPFTYDSEGNLVEVTEEELQGAKDETEKATSKLSQFIRTVPGLAGDIITETADIGRLIVDTTLSTSPLGRSPLIQEKKEKLYDTQDEGIKRVFELLGKDNVEMVRRGDREVPAIKEPEGGLGIVRDIGALGASIVGASKFKYVDDVARKVVPSKSKAVNLGRKFIPSQKTKQLAISGEIGTQFGYNPYEDDLLPSALGEFIGEDSEYLGFLNDYLTGDKQENSALQNRMLMLGDGLLFVAGFAGAGKISNKTGFTDYAKNKGNLTLEQINKFKTGFLTTLKAVKDAGPEAIETFLSKVSTARELNAAQKESIVLNRAKELEAENVKTEGDVTALEPGRISKFFTDTNLMFHENPILRNIESLRRKLFTTQGNRTLDLHEKYLKNENSKEKWNDTVTNVSYNLETAMEKVIAATGKTSDELKEKVSYVLFTDFRSPTTVTTSGGIRLGRRQKGQFEKEVLQLPKELQDPIRAARKLQDELSDLMINTGTLTAKQKKLYQDQMGFYVRRSYKIFEDPNYVVADDVRKEATEYLSKLLKEQEPDLSPNQVLLRVKAQIDEILEVKTGGASLGGKVEKFDKIRKEIIKGKKDIEAPIRKLMGEIEDPTQSLIHSTVKLGHYVENVKFYDEAFEGGAGIYFREEAEGVFKNVIPEGFGNLSGRYTTPELWKYFSSYKKQSEELIGSESAVGGIYRNLLLMKGLSQAAKTVWSHTTHVKNVTGGVQMSLANGINVFNIKQTRDIIKTLRAKTSNDVELQKFHEELSELGLLNKGVVARDLQGLANDLSKTRKGFVIGKLDRGLDYLGVKKLAEKAQNAYIGEDDFFKVNMYLRESEYLKKVNNALPEGHPSKLTEQGLKEEAARMVRDVLPNYDLVPEMLQDLRRTPFFGRFFSFMAESVRISGNTFNNSIREIHKGRQLIKSGATEAGQEVAKRGMKRLTSFMIMGAGAAKGAEKASTVVAGFGPDMIDAVKDFLPDYMQNSNIVVTTAEDGSPVVANLSSWDAYDFPKKPFQVLVNKYLDADTLDDEGLVRDVLTTTLSETVSPFLGESIIQEKLANYFLRGGKSIDGRDIKNSFNKLSVYNDSGTTIENMLNPENLTILMSNLLESVTPGSITRTEDLYKELTATNNKSRFNQDIYESQAFLKFVTGWGMQPLNPEFIETSYKMKANKLVQAKSKSRMRMYAAIGEELNADTFVSEYKKRNMEYYNEYIKFHKATSSLEKFDLNPFVVLKDTRVSRADKFSLIGERTFKPLGLTDDMRLNMLSKAPDRETYVDIQRQIIAIDKELNLLPVLYNKESYKAQQKTIKDVKERLDYKTGGMVLNVEEDPADRVNPNTGISYNEEVEREKFNQGGSSELISMEGEGSFNEEMPSIIQYQSQLKKLEALISNNRLVSKEAQMSSLSGEGYRDPRFIKTTGVKAIDKFGLMPLAPEGSGQVLSTKELGIKGQDSIPDLKAGTYSNKTDVLKYKDISKYTDKTTESTQVHELFHRAARKSEWLDNFYKDETLSNKAPRVSGSRGKQLRNVINEAVAESYEHTSEGGKLDDAALKKSIQYRVSKFNLKYPDKISKDIIKSLPELRKSFEKYSEEIKINK